MSVGPRQKRHLHLTSSISPVCSQNIIADDHIDGKTVAFTEARTQDLVRRTTVVNGGVKDA